MRNIFDQFDQHENRLTHALMSSLDEDRPLLKRFIKWATGKDGPVGNLYVLEQSLAGEEEDFDSSEANGRGLPDGWIHDDANWSLLIESKIECLLTQDQLMRHRLTAQKRGFTNISLVAFVMKIPSFPANYAATLIKWTDLYLWLKENQKVSEWAARLSAYMEVLETKLPKAGYLKGGSLTVFTGFPFSRDNPYNYREAKRQIKLAMVELRGRSDFTGELAIDKEDPGRGSITGKNSTLVWDYLALSIAEGSSGKTKSPHLTLGVHREYLHVVVIIPNGLGGAFRRRLLAGGQEAYRTMFESILIGLTKGLSQVEGVVPSVEVVQRRYPFQRSEPYIDADLSFDLRTAFDQNYGWSESPKYQPQWLAVAYDALDAKDSNLQLAVGAKFYYEKCSAVSTPKILDHIANTWLACAPLLQKMIP